MYVATAGLVSNNSNHHRTRIQLLPEHKKNLLEFVNFDTHKKKLCRLMKSKKRKIGKNTIIKITTNYISSVYFSVIKLFLLYSN